MKHEEELLKWETEIKKGFAKPFILLTLAEKPNYPYQITKTIIGKSKGQVTIAGSNIYPILRKLEQDGLILGQKDIESRKKVYVLTEEGRKFLVPLMKTMKVFNETVQEMIDSHGE